MASLMSMTIGVRGTPTCKSGFANAIKAITPRMAPLAPREGIIVPVDVLMSNETSELKAPALT